MALVLTLLLLGCAVLTIGSIILLIATFRESVLWGIANLFIPGAGLVFICVHWQAGRTAFFWSLAGLVMIGGSLVALSAEAERRGKPGLWTYLASQEGKETADVAPEMIDVQRRQIEQMEAKFHTQGTALVQQYKELNAKRTALKADDAAAVTAFNTEAAAYQQSNTEHKQLQRQLNLAQVELTRLLDERSRLMARPGAAAGVSPANDGTVIMYTTARCGACIHAKEYFARKGVRYEERDVEKSDAARAEFGKLGGRGVPLILIGNERMEGFDERRLNELL
jgi:glutaredoxin